ncbi:hypothetical protein GCM10020221_34130 [Streptomyces thioluteus]|uniref:Transposase n=1 Tax=Streptomyces thioluteus TaxID=66431 RepID=A0ABP6JMJ1_STRTU
MVQLPADGRPPVPAERLGHGLRVSSSRWRGLEVDEGAALVRHLAQPPQPLPRPLRGRKPSKQNRSTGSPDTASAVSTADGPGTAVTFTPRCNRGGDQAVAGVGRPTAIPRVA